MHQRNELDIQLVSKPMIQVILKIQNDEILYNIK